MINHVRTLLLNRASAGGFTVPGEEYVPPAFRPVALPTYLDTVRARLFGADPDRHFLNYRLRQYLTVLHAGPLESYVTAPDPRVTYDYRGEAADLLDPARYRPVVTDVRTPAGERLSVAGGPGTPDPTGRMYQSWGVETTAPGTARLTRQVPSGVSLTVDYALTGGLGPPLALGDSGYSVRLNTTNPGCVWLVELMDRPAWDPGQIVAALDVSGEPTLDALFGVTPEQPYQTFRTLWRTRRELPYRLGAALLAVSYRTDAARKAGG